MNSLEIAHFAFHNLNIGDGVQLAAKSGVMHDLPAGNQYGGQPALPLTEAKRYILASTKLPELLKAFKQLKRRVADLEARLKEHDPDPDSD